MSLKNYRVGEVIEFKTYDRMRNVVRSEFRTIIRLITGCSRQSIIEWSSDKGRGACAPYVWREWAHGVDLSRRYS